MDCPKFIVLSQKEESISIQRVNGAVWSGIILFDSFLAKDDLLSADYIKHGKI